MTGKIAFESSPVALASSPQAGPLPERTATPRRYPPLPVVVGCPRSGTSLLAVMLDSHPLLAVPPETSFLGLVAGLHGTSDTVRRGFFDTVTAHVPGRAHEVVDAARARGINLRRVDADNVGISTDECTSDAHIDAVCDAFGVTTAEATDRAGNHTIKDVTITIEQTTPEPTATPG